MAINTYSEKTLHAALKARYCPDEAYREVACCGGVADICRDGYVTEIQTGSLFSVQKKLDRYYAAQDEIRFPVTVIFPLVRQKWICRVQPETGEVTRRRSPKRGRPWDALYELSHLAAYLCDPRLDFRLLEVDADEYRGEKDRRGREGKIDRVPLDYGNEIPLNSPRDFYCMLPPSLPDRFTVKEYAKATRYNQRRVRACLYVLCKVGFLIKETEKNTNYYAVAPQYRDD